MNLKTQVDVAFMLYGYNGTTLYENKPTPLQLKLN